MLNKTTENAAVSGLLYIVLVPPEVTLKSARAAPDSVNIGELLLKSALTVAFENYHFCFSTLLLSRTLCH